MENIPIVRRSFLLLSAATALALVNLPFLESCGNDSKKMAVALPLLFSHLVNVSEVQEAGAAYLKINPAEDDRSKLSGLLLGNYEQEKLNKNEIQTLLDKQVTNDFKTGNMVIANGWVMSRTEARQCALFSLIKS